MKLTLLFFFAALSSWGQTNAAFVNPGREGSQPPGKNRQINTNQDFPSAQFGEQVRADCIKSRRSICGKILTVLPDGIVVECGYTNLLREPLTRSWLVPGTVTASRADSLVESSEPGSICVGTVYLTDLPKSKKLKPKRFDFVIIEGFPAGQYTYTSVGTIHKTVRRFSAQLSKAVALNLQAKQNNHPPAVEVK